MSTEQLNLPTSEQLAQYRQLRTMLQSHPEDVNEADTQAFCSLLLGMSPDEFEAGDIDLLEKHCPEMWRRYVENEWGTPEEQQALKDDELLAGGWERGPNGEMYIPFP